MATFKDGFGLTETVPTPFGGSAGTQPAPVAVVAVVPAHPGCAAYALGDTVDAAFVAAHPGTTYVVSDTLAEAWPEVVAAATFDPNHTGFGLPMDQHFVAPTVDTTPADGKLDFCGGVVNPKDGFGLPISMTPHASSTPQPTGTYVPYGTL